MRELSYLVALVGGLILIAAAVVWWRVYNEASEAEARASGIDTRLFGTAAKLTSLAFAVTGAAAILAVVSWIVR